jgi:hypothetical protein
VLSRWGAFGAPHDSRCSSVSPRATEAPRMLAAPTHRSPPNAPSMQLRPASARESSTAARAAPRAPPTPPPPHSARTSAERRTELRKSPASWDSNWPPPLFVLERRLQALDVVESTNTA